MLAGILTLLCVLAATAPTDAPPSSGQGAGARRRRGRSVSAKQGASDRRRARAVNEFDALVEALKAKGLTVGRAGDVSQPFFSVEGRALTVAGENVQVFQYRTAEAAAREAARISPDGSGTGTSMVTWVGTPHFFRAGKLIVLYVGDHPKVLEALRASLGTQFAGGKV